MSEQDPSQAATPTTPEPPAPTPTTQAATTPNEPPATEPATTSLINEPPAGPPESYAAFTLPEGARPIDAAISEATPLFKELGLSQSQAQKLVDFYAKTVVDQTKAISDLRVSTIEGWRNQIKADPEIGPNLDKVKVTIGRALAALNDPPLVAEFAKAMDLTGTGDNPAFVKVFNRLCSRISEGTFVSGHGASPLGQTQPGREAPPSLAAAMYPNLSH